MKRRDETRREENVAWRRERDGENDTTWRWSKKIWDRGKRRVESRLDLNPRTLDSERMDLRDSLVTRTTNKEVIFPSIFCVLIHHTACVLRIAWVGL